MQVAIEPSALAANDTTNSGESHMVRVWEEYGRRLYEMLKINPELHLEIYSLLYGDFMVGDCMNFS